MAELALRTTEFIGRKQKYIAYRPIGSVMVSIPDNIVRRKWLEIVCDLVSPKKRQKFTGLPGYNYLCDHWTQQLWDEWRSKCVPTEKYTFGEFNAVETAAQDMWDRVVDGQLITLLAKDPRGLVNKTDTWLWSEQERKRYFIVVNTDAEAYEVQAYMRQIDMIKDGAIITVPSANIKYDTDIGLSQKSIDEINDPNTIVHPKFDSPVAKLIISSPDISNLETK